MPVDFGQPINGLFTAYATAPNGDVYVGGNFSSMSAPNLLKFNSDLSVRDTNFNPSVSVPSIITFDANDGNLVVVVDGSVRLNASDGSVRQQAEAPWDLGAQGVFVDADWTPNGDMIEGGSGGERYYCVPGVTPWIPLTQTTHCSGNGDVPFYLATLCDEDHDGNATDPVGRLQVNFTQYLCHRR